MSSARVRHTLTALRDGRAIAAGGWDGVKTLGSVEILDGAAEGTWTLCGGDVGGAMGTYGHAARGWADTCGRRSGNRGSQPGGRRRYTIRQTDRWTVTGAMSEARDGHTATLLDGRARPGDWGRGGEWRNAGVGGDIRSGDGAVVGGGEYGQAEVEAHRYAACVTGGCWWSGGTTDGTTPLASVEMFDPGTNRWTSGGSIEEARWGHSTILLSDGQALVVGGYGFATLRSAEIYKPAGGGWHSGDSLARWMGDNHPHPSLPPSRGKGLLATRLLAAVHPHPSLPPSRGKGFLRGLYETDNHPYPSLPPSRGKGLRPGGRDS